MAGFAPSQYSSEYRHRDTVSEARAGGISDVAGPAVPVAELQERAYSAIPMLMQNGKISLRGLRLLLLLLLQRMGVDLSSRKALLQRLAEKAVDTWFEGFHMSTMPVNSITDLRNSAAQAVARTVFTGVWEPLPSNLDALDRGRSLFTCCSDVPVETGSIDAAGWNPADNSEVLQAACKADLATPLVPGMEAEHSIDLRERRSITRKAYRFPLSACIWRAVACCRTTTFRQS